MYQIIVKQRHGPWELLPSTATQVSESLDELVGDHRESTDAEEENDLTQSWSERHAFKVFHIMMIFVAGIYSQANPCVDGVVINVLLTW